jgi:DNA mismatch endonuclease (patch repair protein)
MGRANRGRDTGPERRLRSALHRRGLRFRLHQRVAPGLRITPDIVFPRARVVVFVDGCFWHRCPQHGLLPKANREWWADKLAANVARDRRADVELGALGWTVIRVWEHEDSEAAAERVALAVNSVQQSTGRCGKR